jgi:hypothetical protein
VWGAFIENHHNFNGSWSSSGNVLTFTRIKLKPTTMDHAFDLDKNLEFELIDEKTLKMRQSVPRGYISGGHVFKRQ